MTQEILVHAEAGVATITLNRPEKLNAFTGTMREDLLAALESAERNQSVRVAVLTGAGRAFCAGGDVEYMSELQQRGDVTSFRKLLDAGRDVVLQLANMEKPVIAAVNGVAAGAGCNLALACDYRIASEQVKLGQTFVRIGLHPDWGGTWLLPRLVGTSRALDLMLSSRTLTAEEALELGVVNYVVPKEEVLDAAIAYASDLAQNCSPTSMAVMKQQLYGHALIGVDEALKESNKLMRESLTRPDFKEGVASYVEKRSPAFQPLGE